MAADTLAALLVSHARGHQHWQEGREICLQGRLAAEALAVMESGGGPALRTGLEAPHIVIPRGNSPSIAF